MRISSMTMFAVVVGSGMVTAAGGLEYARPELLMDPAELSQPEVAGQFVILDVRGGEQYAEEHLPGARRVDHDAWKSAFGDGRDLAGWSTRIGSLGIGAGSRVVLYDDNRMKDAARIWWILRYWGVEDVRLLNGGWKTWKAKGYRTTDQPTTPAASVKFTVDPRSGRLTTMEQILALLEGNRLQSLRMNCEVRDEVAFG